MNKIKFFIIMAVAGLGGVAWPGVGLAAPQMTLDAAREQADSQMDIMLFRIKMFHHEVKNSMLSTMELPVFKEYFSLPESRHNTLDSNGVLQLSKNQVKLRKKMEEWSRLLCNRFPVGEACLIDRTGQEHLRVVHNKVEDLHFFSSTESDSPFFEPTFQLKAGEIFTSDPYMSPDSEQWVIAYTSPVVLANDDIPAFFHIEIPVDVYNKLVVTQDYSYFTAHQKIQHDKEEEGRYFIVNKEGLLLADSRQEINYKLHANHNPDINKDTSDYMLNEKMSAYFPPVSSINDDPKFLDVTKKMRKGETGEAHLTLNNRAYIMLYRPVPGRSWSLGHLDPVGGAGYWEQQKP
ncbi:MAG: cache domain-containing protein [Magnetococcus sp. YQC-5]